MNSNPITSIKEHDPWVYLHWSQRIPYSSRILGSPAVNSGDPWQELLSSKQHCVLLITPGTICLFLRNKISHFSSYISKRSFCSIIWEKWWSSYLWCTKTYTKFSRIYAYLCYYFLLLFTSK